MTVTNGGSEVTGKQNIETINRKELANLPATHIRQGSPQVKEVLGFLGQIKSPHCLLYRDVPVGVCFTDDDPELGQTLENYFIRIKQG